MTKEEFMMLTEEAAVEHITNTYCTEDINDICVEFMEQYIENLDDEELDSLDCIQEPLEFIMENLNETHLKEFLWEDIVEQCEEIDMEEDGSDAIE